MKSLIFGNLSRLFKGILILSLVNIFVIQEASAKKVKICFGRYSSWKCQDLNEGQRVYCNYKYFGDPLWGTKKFCRYWDANQHSNGSALAWENGSFVIPKDFWRHRDCKPWAAKSYNLSIAAKKISCRSITSSWNVNQYHNWCKGRSQTYANNDYNARMKKFAACQTKFVKKTVKRAQEKAISNNTSRTGYACFGAHSTWYCKPEAFKKGTFKCDKRTFGRDPLHAFRKHCREGHKKGYQVVRGSKIIANEGQTFRVNVPIRKRLSDKAKDSLPDLDHKLPTKIFANINCSVWAKESKEQIKIAIGIGGRCKTHPMLGGDTRSEAQLTDYCKTKNGNMSTRDNQMREALKTCKAAENKIKAAMEAARKKAEEARRKQEEKDEMEIRIANQPEVYNSCYKKMKGELRSTYMRNLRTKSYGPADLSASGICKLGASKQAAEKGKIVSAWERKGKGLQAAPEELARNKCKTDIAPWVVSIVKKYYSRAPNTKEKKNYAEQHCFQKMSKSHIERLIKSDPKVAAAAASRRRRSLKKSSKLNCAGKAKKDVTSAYKRYLKKMPSSSIVTKYTGQICKSGKSLKAVVAEIKKSAKKSGKSRGRKRRRRR